MSRAWYIFFCRLLGMELRASETQIKHSPLSCTPSLIHFFLILPKTPIEKGRVVQTGAARKGEPFQSGRTCQGLLLGYIPDFHSPASCAHQNTFCSGVELQCFHRQLLRTQHYSRHRGKSFSSARQTPELYLKERSSLWSSAKSHRYRQTCPKLSWSHAETRPVHEKTRYLARLSCWELGNHISCHGEGGSPTQEA